MDFKLKDKTAIVTGGGSGLGYEISNKLLSHGANVIIVGRNKGALKYANKQLSEFCINNAFIDYFVCDISDEASVIGGSIGILSSASLGKKMGLFEPIHGSFPEASGKNIANPLACIISVSMMLNYLKLEKGAEMIQKAVEKSLMHKVTTADLNNSFKYKTSDVGDFISKYINNNN